MPRVSPTPTCTRRRTPPLDVQAQVYGQPPRLEEHERGVLGRLALFPVEEDPAERVVAFGLL